MLKGLNTIRCHITNMERAVGFYRDVLGLPPGVHSTGRSDFSVDGVRIGLHPPFGGEFVKPEGRWIIGSEDDDLESFRIKLEKEGAWVGEAFEVPVGRVLEFSDLDGNPIQAIQKSA